MRKIELTNEIIIKGLKLKEELSQEAVELVGKQEAFRKQEEKLVERANQIISLSAKEQDKVTPLIKKELAQIDLGEYEEHSRTYLDDNGKVYMEIADRMEEFKVGFKQQKDAKNNSGDSNKEKGKSDTNAKQPAEGNQNNNNRGQE